MSTVQDTKIETQTEIDRKKERQSKRKRASEWPRQWVIGERERDKPNLQQFQNPSTTTSNIAQEQLVKSWTFSQLSHAEIVTDLYI